MSKKWSILRFKASSEQVGERLDLILANQFEELSRSKAKKVIDLGGVHVNGRRTRSCSGGLKSGDLVEIYLDQLPLEPFRIADEHIVFRDKYLIVLNKPAHIDTQPTHARFKGTLYEALRWYLETPFNKHQKCDIGMVQRLDRGTSGLITFSLHPRAHKGMTETFVQHSIAKKYLAVVTGIPAVDEGEIISLLARSRHDNRVRSVEKGGKEAITRFRVLERFAEHSLLEVVILTGRSHQIRVHMAESGHALLGDTLYGGAPGVGELFFDRPLLHAYQLSFCHPVEKSTLSFEAPIPADMLQAITYLKGFSS